MRPLALAILALTLAAPAAAQSVPVETATLAGQRITLHLHPFLTDEETAILRAVTTNEQALALFIARPRRHAAMAVAPGEGFVRAGQPVASAFAISDMETAESARATALEGCERARREGPGCVVVLEVAPEP